jgi:hypothetical protein
MNEKEMREAKERRSAGRAFRQQQEAEAKSEARRGADALLEEVVEVNEFGQSKLARVRDRETNAVGVIEMVGATGARAVRLAPTIQWMRLRGKEMENERQ